jgi:hypothetical protein
MTVALQSQTLAQLEEHYYKKFLPRLSTWFDRMAAVAHKMVSREHAEFFAVECAKVVDAHFAEEREQERAKAKAEGKLWLAPTWEQSVPVMVEVVYTNSTNAAETRTDLMDLGKSADEIQRGV